MVAAALKLNPFKELWTYLNSVISTGSADAPFIVGSIILIWFIMLGAKWPKKYLFWSWVVFWTLRGAVFRG